MEVFGMVVYLYARGLFFKPYIVVKILDGKHLQLHLQLHDHDLVVSACENVL